jgi:hypothetical protein
MSMRIDIGFPKPLDREGRIRLLLALAPLAKSARVRVVEGGWAAIVRGEALGLAKVREALDEQGLAVDRMATSLPEDEDQSVDEVIPVVGRGERYRPLGR